DRQDLWQLSVFQVQTLSERHLSPSKNSDRQDLWQLSVFQVQTLSERHLSPSKNSDRQDLNLRLSPIKWQAFYGNPPALFKATAYRQAEPSHRDRGRVSQRPQISKNQHRPSERRC
ncbi:MAG: hypothetical protein VKK59_07055, partial [Vampirovibrionales bacterium]|nr:hypothetical protein [Vampirovibrionales bacterium]